MRHDDNDDNHGGINMKKTIMTITLVAALSMMVVGCGSTDKVAVTTPDVQETIESTVNDIDVEATVVEVDEDNVEISIDDEAAAELSQEEIEAMMIDAINEELN